jgi:hypothetical protein
MESIEAHISKDEQILSNPTTSPQQRRHIEGELEELKSYKNNHPNDHHDPTPLELYCELNPEAEECRIYED